ncbi:MAG: Hpt domain-containing protein, partial [Oligoflexales bacterium]|nr:Hpt domain-containing protein [Oligoflexales bacterium]
MLFAVLIAAHIANPIARLTDFAAHLIESNDLSSRASLKGSQEVLSLQKSFNHLLDDIDAKHKKLEEYSKGLETLVDERTSQLRQEKNMIARILEHIELGICIIDKKMQFREQYSKFFASFYHKSKEEIISCEQPISLLFPQIEEGADMINRQHESLFASLGETAFTWDLNSDHLLDEAVIKPDGSRKIVQVWWTPIIEDDVINEVMITIKDVTDQKQLEEQVAKQKKESSKRIDVITQLIAKDKSFVNLFFQDSNKRMDDIDNQVQTDKINPEDVFVNLHTIKGSSRALGFKLISDLAHQAEELVQDLRAGKNIDIDDLRQEIEKVKEELSFYRKTFTSTMGGAEASTESLSVHSVLGQHLATIKANIAKANHSIAGISINDEVLYWNQENFRHIVGVFVHGVNNAIDHGYLRTKKNAIKVEPIIIGDRDNKTIIKNGTLINCFPFKLE